MAGVRRSLRALVITVQFDVGLLRKICHSLLGKDAPHVDQGVDLCLKDSVGVLHLLILLSQFRIFDLELHKSYSAVICVHFGHLFHELLFDKAKLSRLLLFECLQLFLILRSLALPQLCQDVDNLPEQFAPINAVPRNLSNDLFEGSDVYKFSCFN